jgi:hypothetical protein
MDMHTTSEERIERIARRRAGAKMGWYIHASVYVIVNLLLMAIALSNGQAWFIYPALGWGVGLAAHGIAVFMLSGSGLQESLVERERRKLREQQGPW